MSIPIPTGPAVRSYLLAALQARTELAAPTAVVLDSPGTYLPDDLVVLGAPTVVAFNVQRMVGSGAAGWLDERYEVPVDVDCYLGGDDPQTVYARAAYLAGVVIDVVRLDPSLGGLVIQAHPVSLDVTAELEEEHLGRRVSAQLLIGVYAQI